MCPITYNIESGKKAIWKTAPNIKMRHTQTTLKLIYFPYKVLVPSNTDAIHAGDIYHCKFASILICRANIEHKN